MLGAVPGQSCSVYCTCFRLFKEWCPAELQQILGKRGCQRPLEKGKFSHLHRAQESRVHGLVMSVESSSDVEQR